MPRQYMRVPILERLWLKSVRVGECLVWQGWVDRDGYGHITISRTQAEQTRDGKRRTTSARVHVVAYSLLVGPIPEGHEVQHSCNNRPCWAPSHLSTGTQRRNADHREASGNTVRGERSKQARLTVDIVRQIRARHAAGGITFRDLGHQYDLSGTHIARLIHRQAWAHIE